jgi:membrane protein
MASDDPGEKKGILHLFKKTVTQFIDDDCMTMGAALAFYTIFALPPLLVILIAIGSAVFDRQQVEQALETQMQGVMNSEQIDEIVARTQEGGAGLTAGLISLAVLVFTATGVVAQLQTALNRVWEVQPDPKRGGIRTFISKRAFSLILILVVAFLLLMSLVLSSVISVLGDEVTSFLPQGFSGPILWGTNLLLSWLIFTLLFGAIYKVLPDADITWKDVAVGAAVTALLFLLGQFLLSLYFGRVEVGGPYGAAGSLALVLIWVYYSSLIMLLGAEFTQVWARRYGQRIQPSDGAVRAFHIIRQEQDPDAPSPRDQCEEAV